MGLVVCDGGVQDLAKVTRDAIYLRYFLRLFTNDWEPQRGDTVVRYTEAVFSGYPGPVQITGWSQPVLSAHVSTITALPVMYAHSAGPFGNFIFGYYVTTQAGTLVWAERRPGIGLPMFSAGDSYVVVPRLSFTSDLP
jgi:hypothetical protein